MAARTTFRAPASLAWHTQCLLPRLSGIQTPLRPTGTILKAATSAATPSYHRRRYLSSSFDGSSLPPSTLSQPIKQHVDEKTQLQEDPAAGDDLVPDETTEPLSTDGDATPTAEDPWYLQVEPPRHPTLMPHHAPIPPTPADAPALIEPLIKFIAEELGVDDFNVLDLRTLDPPPALGPKLIMMFGTARSDRHLHVSADRLVRWLRGRGITADADGLLGRNELKIKMRRRMRKAKLMGDATWDKADDGITTGWICVNLGTLSWTPRGATSSPAAAEERAVESVLDDSGRVTGFGAAPIDGTTVVVQLLTERKREELGLERLWNGVLRKSNRDREELEAARAAAEAAAIEGKVPKSVPYLSSTQRWERRLTDYGPAPGRRR